MPPHHHHLRAPRLRPLSVLLFAAALASCAAPHPAPQPAALPLPPPAPPVRPIPAVLHATWSFQASQESCLATAKAGPASLLITIHREGPIRLSLTLPHDAPARPSLRFAGPAGGWQIGATTAGPRTVVLALPRTDATLSRILIVLSGGMLRLEPAAVPAPILALPESGADGRNWFACARQSVDGT